MQTLSTFGQRVLASGLVSYEQLNKCQAAIGDRAGDQQLIELLIKLNMLTKWQAAQLQAGKERGYFLAQHKLMEPLGAGGMGQVYRALDTKLNRPVAVKVLPRRLATRDSVERFRREGRVSLEVNHENLVRSFELGHDGDTHFLVMELVDGTNLAKYIERKGTLSVLETARIGYEVAQALTHARQHGIIHRDIKPSNILLTRSGRAKLTDLGLAKFFGVRDERRAAALTQTGAFMGTVDYCAPEQAEDARHADTRSDIYSLGCTLYHCLVGQPPFPAGTTVQKLVAHREHDARPISALRRDVPQALSDLIMRHMLAKRPDDRFQTPAETAEALRPWTRGQPAEQDLSLLATLIEEDQATTRAKPPSSTARDAKPHQTTPRPDSSEPILWHEESPLASRGSSWSRSRSRSATRSPRFALMLATIAIGTVLGLIAVWQFDPFGLDRAPSGPPGDGPLNDLEQIGNRPPVPGLPPGMMPPNMPASPGAVPPVPPGDELSPPAAAPPGAARSDLSLTGGDEFASGEAATGSGDRPSPPDAGNPAGESAETSGDVRIPSWYRNALGRCHQRNWTLHRDECARLLSRFADTTDPGVAHLVARACVLAPDAVTDLSQPVALARRAATQRPERLEYLGTLGAALYRQGEFEECVKVLNDAIARMGAGQQDGSPRGTVFEWLFLAMAQHRLGNNAEARQWLDRVPRQPGATGLITPGGGLSQLAGIEADILRREAESLINSAAPSGRAPRR